MIGLRASVRRTISSGLLVLAVMVAAVAPVVAEPPSGHDDDTFRAALALWLADDEAEALPRLAEQAQAGNDAARLLLALIDTTAALQGPWLAALPRADRIALMRAPGGLSGRSWIHAAADASPLAALWRALWRAEPDPALPIAFAKAAEPRAARAAVVIQSARGVRGMEAYLAHPAFPPGVRYLLVGGPDDPLIDSLHPGDPQRLFIPAPHSGADFPDWLATAPEALLLRGLCDARCPETAAACTRAAYAALNDHATLLMLGAPSEVLVPAREFAASARGHSALLRRAMMSTQARGRARQMEALSKIDACFVAQLTAEVDRFRGYRERPSE